MMCDSKQHVMCSKKFKKVTKTKAKMEVKAINGKNVTAAAQNPSYILEKKDVSKDINKNELI